MTTDNVWENTGKREREQSRAWIELNMEHLKQNIESFQRLIPCGCKMMPAVKAEAYGHGAVLIARNLQNAGVTDFCVASVEEGVELRKAGISGKILVLSYTPRGAVYKLSDYNLIQTVVDKEYANMLMETGVKLRVHIGIDTGMHRLGIWWEDTEDILEIWQKENLTICGVFSHLCVADSKRKEDRQFTRRQKERFDQVIEILHKAGKKDFVVHLQSSYGILNYRECNYDYVRPGIAMYGVLSKKGDWVDTPVSLKPVLSLKSRIECIRNLKAGEGAGYGLDFTAQRDSRLAVLSIGYADGIPRNLSEKGFVLCHGKEAKIVGRICMDQMLIDVTDIKEASPNDEVVLIGKSNNIQIYAEQFAEWADTITNEVLSRLGGRLERVVV